jgi:glycosyltransferase involved in cell wall biosynthesis
MISVIICSVDETYQAQVRENIANTIGVPYEVIIISNALELGGMCAAYNKGAERARYDLLCFMHDDVEFLTEQWGQKVNAHFADPELAMIGLAGSRYKSKTLSGWWSGLKEADCCNIYQRWQDGSDRQVVLRPQHITNETAIPVKTLDGVWICMRKQVWSAHPFNSDDLKGFHFYDLDISLRVSATHKIAVVYDVAMVHFSNGTFGDDWIQSALHFHNVVSVALPCSIDGAVSAETERKVNRSWLRRLCREDICLSNKVRWSNQGGAWQHPGNYRYIGKFFLSFFSSYKHKSLKRTVPQAEEAQPVAIPA